MIGQFNSFHQPIRRMTGYAQRGSDVFESLVMETVDFENWLVMDRGNASRLLQFDFVHEDRPHVAGVVMIECPRKLVRDVGVESAAKSNIEHLAAAADAEEWFAVRGGSLDHFPFERIPRGVHPIDAWMRLTGRKLEGNVPAAGKENPIQARIDRIPSIFSNHR